jgi:hypothetical protein
MMDYRSHRQVLSVVLPLGVRDGSMRPRHRQHVLTDGTERHHSGCRPVVAVGAAT